MRVITLASTITLMVLAPVGRSAVAIDANGGIAIWGAGQVSCGAWLEGRQIPREQTPPGDHRREGREQWLLGYITASNLHTPNHADLMAGTDPPGVYAWVDRWCRAHPLKTIYNAANELIIELTGRH
jgi:hypothetical protein